MVLILALIVNFFITLVFMMFLLPLLSLILPFVATDQLIMGVTILTMIVLGVIGLTPLGEKFFRRLNGAREPIKKESGAIEPIFSRVVEQCGFKRNQFDLCVIDDMMPNAFALGRRTVAMTRGAMQLPEDEQEGIFAHELGHMQFKDSIRGMVFYMITGAGQVMLVILNRLGAGLSRLGGIPFVGLFVALFGLFLNWITVLVSFLIMLPLFIGEKFGSRLQEYRADKFALDSGHGQGLVNFLYRLMDVDTKASGVMAVLMRSHPVSGERIKRIEDLLDSYDVATEVGG